MHQQLAATRVSEVVRDDLFEAFWRTTPDGLFRVEVLADGNFEFGGLNPAHEAATGLKSAELLGRRPQDILDAETAAKVLARYQACVKVREPIRYMEVLKLPTGERLWDTSLTPIVGSDGRVRLLLGSSRDLTDQLKMHDALLANEDRLRTLLSSIDDCYYTVDKAGRLTDMNEKAAAWFGVERSHAIGMQTGEAAAINPAIAGPVQRALRDGEATHVEAESRFRPGRWMEMHIYPSEMGAMVLFRDITVRKHEAQELERARKLLGGALDALTAQVLILDGDGTIVGANAAFQSFALVRGLAPAVIGENYLQRTNGLRAGARLTAVRQGLAEVLEGGKSSFQTEYEMQVGGAPRHFQLRVSRFDHDGDARVVLAHEDVTDAVHAIALARETSERVAAGQDQERRRIAMELHDSTGQQLVAMNLTLMQLRRVIQADSAAGVLIDELSRSLKDAQTEIRTLSYLIHPPGLEQEGIDSLIRRFAEGFARRSGVKVDVRLPRRMPVLDEARERAIFRMVQEALVNVHRHSGARRVDIRLRQEVHGLVLVIKDDGRGFPATPSIRAGSGVHGMVERVRQVGGDLEISDGPGATLTAWVPLCPDQRGA